LACSRGLSSSYCNLMTLLTECERSCEATNAGSSYENL